jgi:hypothetical protein
VYSMGGGIARRVGQLRSLMGLPSLCTVASEERFARLSLED